MILPFGAWDPFGKEEEPEGRDARLFERTKAVPDRGVARLLGEPLGQDLRWRSVFVHARGDHYLREREGKVAGERY